jgi:hypothetical protein
VQSLEDEKVGLPLARLTVREAFEDVGGLTRLAPRPVEVLPPPRRTLFVRRSGRRRSRKVKRHLRSCVGSERGREYFVHEVNRLCVFRHDAFLSDLDVFVYRLPPDAFLPEEEVVLVVGEDLLLEETGVIGLELFEDFDDVFEGVTHSWLLALLLYHGAPALHGSARKQGVVYSKGVYRISKIASS